MEYAAETLDIGRAQARAMRDYVPDVFSAYAQLGRAALSPGALDTKTKELIALAVSVTREDTAGWDKADGIVVLTGGDNRIEAGAKLMSEGRAKRMLISGVNRKVTREEMQRLLGVDKGIFNCCVDLGYEALDTVGNAH